MTPQEKQQFDIMARELERLTNIVTGDNASLFDGYKGASDSAITKSIGAGGGTVVDFPDELILFRYNGKVGRLAWWNESRF